LGRGIEIPGFLDKEGNTASPSGVSANKEVEDMESHSKKYWWWYLLRGILALLFGTSVVVTAVLLPETTIYALVVSLGAYLVLTGVVSVASAIAHRSKPHWGSLLVNGLLHITLGILAFFWTDVTAVALLFMFAISMVAIGLLDLVSSIRLRHSFNRPWTVAVSGVLSMLVGGGIMIFPALGAFGVMWIIGGMSALFGAFSISCGWRMRNGPHRRAPQEQEVHPQAESAPA
jgi:uncharacterized membrane protein HdeD (DUF308 family)